MTGIEFLLIPEFRDKLCWNNLYYHLKKGL